MADSPLIISPDFQHILRILNTNIDGRRKVQFALTMIKGVGRRFSGLICKQAEVDPTKRAGELTQDEIEKLVKVIMEPLHFKVPVWFLNRQKDIKSGKHGQLYSNLIDQRLREDLERLKKIRAHRGVRHYLGIRVRGQHTKTSSRRGKTVGAGGRK